MARILVNGLIQFNDGRILYCDTVLTGCDFMELQELLPQINPTLGRSAMIGFPFISGGGGGQGPQGQQGQQGPPGPPGPGSGKDLFAATRIVSLDPTQGTDLTIQDAINNLPAEGGKIFVKQGTYIVAATLILPDGKSVMIAGAGKGSTVISLPTAGIPLFQIGAAATGIYGFRDFTAEGIGLSTQTFLDVEAAVDVTVENVDVTAFRHIVDVTAAAEVEFRSCKFTMPSLTFCSFWNGSGTPGKLTWLNVEATLPIITSNAISGGPDWDVTDSYVGGPPALSVYAVRVVLWQGFNLDKADVRISGDGSRIVNFQGKDTILKVLNRKTTIANSVFLDITSVSTFIQIDGDGVSPIADVTVSGCVFDGAGHPLRCIAVTHVTDVVIDGCVFRGYTAEAILLSAGTPATKVSITGCRFEQTGVTPVREDGTDVEGRYSNNFGFGGSLLLGPKSLVENENYRNVRTWGAVGDGVTDDSPAIQSAIDALPALGGVLYFPPGTYLLGTTLLLPNKSVMILGAGSSLGTVGATTLSVTSAIPAFHVPGAVAVLQHFMVRDLDFTGTGVAGQHAFQVDSAAQVEMEECMFAAIDAIFNCGDAPFCKLTDCLAFPVNSIYATATPGSVLDIATSLIFVTGTLGISGDPSTHISDTNINAFGTITMDLGGFSVIANTRVAGATVNGNGGTSRFEGYASDSSLLDLKVTSNNVVSGALIEAAAVGISIGGLRNTVVGCRFNGVAAPVVEVGAADFNLFDGINGFAGSVVIGGSSVVGTVIP